MPMVILGSISLEMGGRRNPERGWRNQRLRSLPGNHVIELYMPTGAVIIRFLLQKPA